MGRLPQVSFRFEKKRLLRRARHCELWEGWIRDQPHLIQRFSPGYAFSTDDYLLLSRRKHPLLLRTSLAGYSKDRSFCYAMPLESWPAREITIVNPEKFSIQMLSLILALQQEQLSLTWHSQEMIVDPSTQDMKLCGIHAKKIRNIHAHEILQLTALSKLLSKHHTANHPVIKTLRKWMRRKDSVLRGCLSELISISGLVEETIYVNEWEFSRELELIGGLSRLAEQGKGRSLMFHGGPGEGKTTLLRQIYRNQLLRGSRAVYFTAAKEERPYQSIKNVLQACALQWGFIEELPRELSEDNVVTAFLKLFRNPTTVFVVMLDGFQNMDVYSKRAWIAVSRRITECPALMLSTCRNAVQEAEDSAVLLPISKPRFRQLEECIHVPLWQEKQKKSYFHEIYQKTSGNALFFYEYLLEAIRQRAKTIRWEDGRWSFSESLVPSFPEGLLEFYWSSAPALSKEEVEFLQLVAVQGETIDAPGTHETVARELIQKNVLVRTSNQYRFQNRLFAEAVLNQIEPSRLKKIHQELAENLSTRSAPNSYLLLARHSLRGGDPSRALYWTTKAIRELGEDYEPHALSLLEELDAEHSRLSLQESMEFHFLKGNLYFRRGKYSAAASSFRKIWLSASIGIPQRFEAGVLMAECYLLQENIHSAQETLAELASLIAQIQDERSLFRYHLAKGLYAHYRGPRAVDDFQKAFDLAQKIGDESLQARAHRCSAWFFLQEGRLAEASVDARRGLHYAKLAGNHEEIGNSYKIFASIAWRKSRHKIAEGFMKRSIRAFQRAKNQFGSAGVWNLLGNVYVEKYRFHEAIECFEKSIQLFAHLDHSREVSFARFNMGLAYLEVGRLKDAEKIFLRCRDIDRKSGNRWFYAYDLRALAVYCILQGYPRRAERLLKKTIEICEQLSAEGDILQTKMILLFLYLQQRNLTAARPLVSLIEKLLPSLKEPLTIAEIHHLLAFYYGCANEFANAAVHLKKSDQVASKIQYFKLIGKNRILEIMFRNEPPAANDLEFRKAVQLFRKSRNSLEFCDYLLLLYQTFPALLKEKQHAKRRRWMESIYRDLHIQSRLRDLRKLGPARKTEIQGGDPAYEWWDHVLNLFAETREFDDLLRNVLKHLSSEMEAQFTAVHYLSHSGTFDRIVYCSDPLLKSAEDVPARIFAQALKQKESLCINVSMDVEIARTSWAMVNEVRSILAVPFFSGGQVLGIWYFERRGNQPVFMPGELQKLKFFAKVSLPYLQNLIQRQPALSIKNDRRAGQNGNLIGSSKAMQQLHRLIEKVAPLDVSVLIQGESGTGKELIARRIHESGRRSRGPFVALNCSAIPESLIESELFGHSRGAFTGAVAAKAGSLERANSGTLFLDEIGDLSLSAQAKLLRVIQEREIQRLGETAVRKVDVRFVFATHKDLMTMVRSGAYREDLYYRIRGYVIEVPPLRERREDVPLLANHFIEKYCAAFGKSEITLSPSAMKRLCDYSWPGNIREMENLIQSILVNSDSETTVQCDAFESSLSSRHAIMEPGGVSLEEGREQFDREFVRQALQKHHWNKSKTAKELKITRQGLINLIHRLKIEEK